MEKKLLATLFIIPLASIAITWLVLQTNTITENSVDFPDADPAKKVADTFFNYSTIINFGETGLPESKVIGDQLFHYPGEEDSEIINPKVTFFREEGSPVFITADHGWINEDGTRVILKGHTVILREKTSVNQFSKLETPELTIWPNREYAETDKAVKITTGSTLATGVGMEAWLDQEHYLLLNNVKARHIPAKKQD